MSATTFFRRLKEKKIRRHSSAIKPLLSEANKRTRLQFCLSMVDPESIPHDPFFLDMYNTVHIDEKWFYMTRKCLHYYLLPEKEDPVRTCKSKNYIEKVMFLASTARPRFDSRENELFSGKIGIYPFITQQAAKRDSVNRVASTLETKSISSINRDVMGSFLIEKIIPDIKKIWLKEDSCYPIFIQQDNAKPHIRHKDEEFQKVAQQDVFDIRLICQPPNSPDLNMLDLEFFNAIQSLQHQEAPKTMHELVNAVIKAYELFPTEKINRIFLTLQSCMVEIMRAKGSNKYNISHIKKVMLEKEGQLPIQLKCDPELIDDVLNYLG
ncbi:hypothetical protein P3S68_004035 [Capsicum galapagoense]